MKMLRAIPVLPVKDMKRSLIFYCDILGFSLGHHEKGFAALYINQVRFLHLWEASDETWQTRNSLEPIVSGAESFLAGTASCRIEVAGIDDAYQRMEPLGIVHPNAPLRDQWWGERDFGVVDPDNNVITFYEITNSK